MNPGWMPGFLAACGLWLAWMTVIEPRRLQRRWYRLRPGTGPEPIAPGSVARGSVARDGGEAQGEAPREEGRGGRPYLRIAHLTDLHSPVYRINEAALLAAVRAQQPDLVAFTGDLAEGAGLPFDRGIRLLARLAAECPVYVVPGNHDHLAGWRRIERELRACGARVLVNRGELFEASGRAFYIAGVDDPHTGRDRLDEALSAAPPGTPVILLAHAPSDRIRRLAPERRIHLVLTGHTHGGQVRLPWLGALWIPGQGWLPRCDRGWFRLGDTYMLINAGLGTPKPWIRWLCPPEVVFIELGW